MELLIIVIALALIFDFINGFHDAANSIATIVSTKVLSPFQAVVWAAAFNFVAFFIFKDHAVANTIGKTVYSDFITLPVILTGLLAAIAWNLLTWYYGIPSSSSHTLIGSFAGAAICHAFLTKGYMPVNEVIASNQVGKIIAFIFLAPLVGMGISIFFTLIFIQRKTWLKVGIICALAVVIYFVFIGFQENKLVKNMGKFFKVDEYSIAVDIKHDLSKEDDLKHAKSMVEACKPFLADYEEKGADYVAENIVKNVDLNRIHVTLIEDKISSYFKLDLIKNKAKNDPKYQRQYENTKQSVDELKPLASLCPEVGFDSMFATMMLKHPMSLTETETFRSSVNVDVKEAIIKKLDMANNRYLRWSIVIVLIIFALTFIYTEKIREPNASRTSHAFKKLQLVSSAAFSIGHGGNDAQKVMGIIAAALVTNGNIVDIKAMPSWVPLACYAAIALGTLSGGWRIVKTVGTRITKVTPLEGVSAETAGATTLLVTEQMGIPVSTTHTITGSIVGVGLVKGISSVKWGVTISLLWAWILTIPVSALLAGAFYLIYSIFI
ncbi:MAG: inorganic phosphate transporter [Flavobacteriales bacterium]|nr:inorganic phosphate transporter [Flavobacteriales bacterium]